MTDEEKKEFMRINAFLVRFSMSTSAYKNLNIALLAKQAQKDIESILRAEGYTDRQITDYWLKHK